MTPEKRKKIQAMLANPASSENEKAICRKILKNNPVTATDGMFANCKRAAPKKRNFFDGLFGTALGGLDDTTNWEDAERRQRDMIEIRREAFRNQAQQRLVDLLRKKK